MKGVWKVYRSDIKQIFSNRAAGLVILVLCILPALYARFYLKSSRDPYGQTQGLKVAIVNNDLGTVFKERPLNIWAELLNELKEDTNIGRVFVDEALAQSGVQNWAYYASIIISKDFSEKMTSLLDEIPQNPQLLYTVNEKLNAIVPKITDKGASSIKENIQKAFIDAVNQVVMEKLNQIWLDLKASKANVYSMISFFHDFRKVVDNMDKKITTALETSYRLRWKLEEAGGKIPNLEKKVQDAQELLSSTAFLANNTLDFIDTKVPEFRENMKDLTKILDDTNYELKRILNKADQKSEEFAHDVHQISSKLSATESKLQNNIANINKIQQLIWTFLPNAKILAPLNTIHGKLNSISMQSSKLRSGLHEASTALEKGVEFWQKTQRSLENLRQDFKHNLDEAKDSYQKDIEPYLQDSLQEIRKMTIDGYLNLQEFEKKIPNIEQGVDNWLELINTEIERLKDFQQKLPKLQASVRKVDHKFQKLKADWVIEDFIEVATLNPLRFAQFMAEPVQLIENRLFAIPNYGSAMSPFFTTLAIRVGSLLLVSLLTTKVKSEFSTRFSKRECFIGKWFVFLSIAWIQALVVSLWDIFLLKAYVADKIAFILASLLIATTFSMIIYSTVSTFGNWGKALAILLLVLQLSWAGGTFPIELSGSFFQNINPRLPFTYAINAMREAVWGMYWKTYSLNLATLWGFWGCFLLIGLYLKPLLTDLVAKFEHTFHQSGLWEH